LGFGEEFSSDDLAKGVNLAAEFLVNPFCDQFNKINAAVQAHQAQDKLVVRAFLHCQSDLLKMAPNSKAEVDKIGADGMAQEKKLFDAAAALVVPVHHTIKIESEP